MMKRHSTWWLRGACACLLLGGVMLLTPGCATYGGAGYVGYYDYDYYPDWDVYFYPGGGIYYWHDGGRWFSGRRLPPRYELRESHHEHYRFRTRQPWTEHRPEGREHREEHEGHEHH